MKALTLIPKKIKETYQIVKWSGNLSIHTPCYVNINFDKRFKITKDEREIIIRNSKCVVCLSLKKKWIHITIF